MALKKIDEGGIKFAIVTDKKNHFLGTITDGDIRRALLKGVSLEEKVKDYYNKKPLIASAKTSKEELIALATAYKIYQIPVVDENHKIIKIALLDELVSKKYYSNKVVLMVGGEGKRLRPLTEKTPKPMLMVGNKPILQTIIENFKKCGFKEFIFCVNYRHRIIQNFFKDGEKFGVTIEYVIENKKLGTAGALAFLKKIKEPFFVMNGDLLTTIDFEEMMQFHIKNKGEISVGTKEFLYQLPFGVVLSKNDRITKIEEKPVIKKQINAGIYILNPSIIDFIPENSFFDMPQLIKKMLLLKKNILSFPISDYWIDIGRIEEFRKANEEYFYFFS
jgi:dTDP-glucose pyrophosphorylase